MMMMMLWIVLAYPRTRAPGLAQSDSQLPDDPSSRRSKRLSLTSAIGNCYITEKVLYIVKMGSNTDVSHVVGIELSNHLYTMINMNM